MKGRESQTTRTTRRGFLEGSVVAAAAFTTLPRHLGSVVPLTDRGDLELELDEGKIEKVEQ